MNNDEIWKDDKLGRQGDADFLERFLRNNAEDLAKRGARKSFVLNLDAGWGRGKTFFLTRFEAQVEAAGHLAAYVNAWQDDFADDPLTAVMAAIDSVVTANVKPDSQTAQAWTVVRKTAGKVALQVGKGLLMRGLSMLLTETVATGLEATFAEGVTDKTAKETGEAIASEAGRAIEAAIDERTQKSVAEFIETKRTLETFRTQLSTFVNAMAEDGKAPPFFVLVDELDRCRPPYAIAMLERIKHLFEIPNVAFVIATDSGQLRHSIRAVYGAEFDSSKYLKRFFDSSFEFEISDIKSLVQELLYESNIDEKNSHSLMR